MPKTIRQEREGERELAGGREIRPHDREDGGPAVPAILHLPVGDLPVPGVLLLHGDSTRKEVLADAVGGALLARGLASLAIDLPLHGTRADTRSPREGVDWHRPCYSAAKERLPLTGGLMARTIGE